MASSKAAPMAAEDQEAMLDALIVRKLYGFAESMALKCAVELRIADIIHSHGELITLSQLASAIDDHSPSTIISSLQRIMRTLVRMKIFTVTSPQDSSASSNGGEEPLYGLTPLSKALLHDAEISVVPHVILGTHPFVLGSWYHLSGCVREGGSGFKKAHGCEIFEMAATSPRFNEIFNVAMQSTAKIHAKAIVSKYADGLSGVESMADVGGGYGHLIAEIVKAFPHIKGFNFDLPHVVATAPDYANVVHITGDMFTSIPSIADALILKNLLHDWDDKDCVKILRNCRKAIPEDKGKIIIVDMVVKEKDSKDKGVFSLDVAFDLLMMALSDGGKERTEIEWEKILKEGGFPRYKIIELTFLGSLIEAYPK